MISKIVRLPVLFLFATVLVIPGSALRGQDAPKDRQNVGLPQISVIDKLLAAEISLGPSMKLRDEEAWASQYKALYGKYKEEANPGNMSKSRTVLAMALGIKASDGVIALKARDMEALNDCAEQIEKLAAKLEVPGKNLERASIVKHHAKQQHWVEAFMELGYLQYQIMRTLENNPEQRDDAMLVIIGGWLQGGRCVTGLLSEHYTPEASNILREPKLVALMIKELDKLKPEYKQDPVVAAVLKFLPDVQHKIDVGLHDPIPLEVLKSLNEGFERLVKLIMKPSAAAP